MKNVSLKKIALILVFITTPIGAWSATDLPTFRSLLEVYEYGDANSTENGGHLVFGSVEPEGKVFARVWRTYLVKENYCSTSLINHPIIRKPVMVTALHCINSGDYDDVSDNVRQVGGFMGFQLPTASIGLEAENGSEYDRGRDFFMSKVDEKEASKFKDSTHELADRPALPGEQVYIEGYKAVLGVGSTLSAYGCVAAGKVFITMEENLEADKDANWGVYEMAYCQSNQTGGGMSGGVVYNANGEFLGVTARVINKSSTNNMSKQIVIYGGLTKQDYEHAAEGHLLPYYENNVIATGLVSIFTAKKETTKRRNNVAARKSGTNSLLSVTHFDQITAWGFDRASISYKDNVLDGSSVFTKEASVDSKSPKDDLTQTFYSFQQGLLCKSFVVGKGKALGSYGKNEKTPKDICRANGTFDHADSLEEAILFHNPHLTMEDLKKM